MSRNFTVTTGQYISLGDLAGARFQRLQAWTCLCFFRVENYSGDHRTPISKRDAQSQFHLRINSSASEPTAIQVQCAGTGATATISSQVYLNTWYMAAVVNDGTGGAGGVRLYLYNMAGTQLGNATGTFPASDLSPLTDIVSVGARGDASSATDDLMDGDVAHVAYLKAALTQPQVEEYLRAPAAVVARLSASAEFYLPLLGASPEPDHSGAGHNGTVNGTLTVTDMPPVRWGLGAADPQSWGVASTGPITVNVGVEALSLSALTATIVPGAVALSPGLTTLTLSVSDPTAATGTITVSLSALALDLSELDPTAQPGEIVLVVGVLTNSLGALTPTTGGTVTLVPLELALTLTLDNPTVEAGGDLVADVGVLSLPLSLADPDLIPGERTLTFAFPLSFGAIGLHPHVEAHAPPNYSLGGVRVFLAGFTFDPIYATAVAGFLAEVPTLAGSPVGLALVPPLPAPAPASVAVGVALPQAAGLALARVA